jgi:hypothetical protein
VAPPKKSKNLLIIAVIAVVAIVIIAIATIALAGNNSGSSNDNNTDQNGTNSNDQLAMTVNSVRGYKSTNMFMQPEDGNQHVMVYANLTNKGLTTMWVSVIYLTLTDSNGGEHDLTLLVDVSTSNNLESDRTMALYCGFEIPKTATPKTLTYDDGTDKISVTIPSSIVNLVVPDFVKMTLVGVAPASSGNEFLTPDAGNEYVNVTVKFTNLMGESMTLSVFDFTLKTDDGLTHDVTYDVDQTIPDGVQAGANTTLVLPFEIAISAAATELVYDDGVSVINITL